MAPASKKDSNNAKKVASPAKTTKRPSKAPRVSPPPVKQPPISPQPQSLLYRNTDQAIIAGVCSGLANYFAVNSLIIRILFILLVFFGGFGMVLYLIMWATIPVQSAITTQSATTKSNQPWSKILASICITAGTLWLLDNFGLNPFTRISWDKMWPSILIIIGVYLLVKNKK